MFESLITTLQDKTEALPKQYQETTESEAARLQFEETFAEAKIKETFLSFYKQYREAVCEAEDCLRRTGETLDGSEFDDTEDDSVEVCTFSSRVSSSPRIPTQQPTIGCSPNAGNSFQQRRSPNSL